MSNADPLGPAALRVRHDRTPARAGDWVDFDSFYESHRAIAVRWAVALVASRGIAEELAQDALVAMQARWSTIGDPGAYLRRTITHRAASWHRGHAREERRLRRVHAAAPTSYTAETHELLDALGSLPYRQRAAVSLRYWADWTDTDIADALGCAPATVRVLVHRGLSALRKELEP